MKLLIILLLLLPASEAFIQCTANYCTDMYVKPAISPNILINPVVSYEKKGELYNKTALEAILAAQQPQVGGAGAFKKEDTVLLTLGSISFILFIVGIIKKDEEEEKEIEEE